jgi:NTE family protein
MASDSERPKVGVVLSGGGAKGVAHVGALKVIEEAGIKIDFITGTSMGSIVGAFYAMGYTIEQMEEITLSNNWMEMFDEKPGRRLLSMYEKEQDERFLLSLPINQTGVDLPAGIIKGHNINLFLSKYTWPVQHVTDFNQFPIPFATVATDLETGEAVVFRSGSLPDAIRASVSIPSAIVPYVIDGKTLIDGGVSNNLPVREILEMGADIVIAVDVTTPIQHPDSLKSLTDILNQTVNYRIDERMNEQRELADMVIYVKEIRTYNISDFDKTDIFLTIGENAARTYWDELNQISQKQNAPPYERQRLENNKPVRINSIEVQGNRSVPADFFLRELEVFYNKEILPQEIEDIIEKLYSSRLFDTIRYRILEEGDGDFRLLITVEENDQNTFRLGARYDNLSQASIYLNSSFRNLLLRGSTARFNLRLGNYTFGEVDYLFYGGLTSGSGVRLKAGLYSDNIDWYDGLDERQASFRSTMLRMDLFAGTYFSNTILLGTGIRRDFLWSDEEINPQLIPFSGQNHHSFYARFWLDTYNRLYFPTSGNSVQLKAVISDPVFLSELSFNQLSIYWKAAYPATDHLTLNHLIYLGRTVGDNLPYSYWFKLNRPTQNFGNIPFGGFKRDQLTGRNIQMVSAGVQYEFFRHRFVSINTYFGNTLPKWNFEVLSNEYYAGYSLSFGAITVLGPIEAIISTSTRNALLFELQIGYEF